VAKKVGETFTPFSPLCSAFFRQACVLTTLLYPPRLIHQTRTVGISRVAVPLKRRSGGAGPSQHMNMA